MATVLLIFIYIFYIGLGIPDSMLGTAWPAVYGEFHVPVSYASFVSAVISGGTVVSSLFSTKIIAKLGTAKVTAISTGLTAAALLGFSCSQNFLWFCLCAIPLGIGAGSIDTALNNYVAVHYNAMQMSFLHCFYGIGVTVSPYLMSIALSEQMNWRGGYRTVFYIQTVIAVLAAAVITFYFAGMTLGRILSGLLSVKYSDWQIIFAGEAVILISVVILLADKSITAVIPGLFLIGLGNGPVFPNMTHITPVLYRKETLQSVIGIQMAFSNLSIMLTPVLFGVLADVTGPGIFPGFLLVMFVLMAGCTAVLKVGDERSQR